MGVTAATIALQSGYGEKSAAAILVPCLAASALAAYQALRKKPRATWFFLVLTIFVLTIYLAPPSFLDTYFHFVVPAFLTFLFVHQATQVAEQRRVLEIERSRADRLQLTLDQRLDLDSPPKLNIRSAGRTIVVPTNEVVYCKGAGDYVEVVCINSRRHLHNSSLIKLEQELSAVFLRVHRSYIVSTDYILSLKREATGSGLLKMSTGEKIPVSRRIMPTVRKSIT